MKELDPYRPLLKKISKHGYQAYFVGGCVRNAYFKKKINDIDIATDAPIEKVVEIFSDRKLDKQGIVFFSVSFPYKSKTVTITPFRQEGEYVKHRYPSEVSYTNNIEIDAQRRDFTMNALYVDEHGEVFDFYDGLIHIKEKRLVSIKNADRSMSEDALRILRALRFMAVFDLKLDESLSEAIDTHASLVHRLSRHSLNHEIEKLQEQATSDQQTQYYKSLIKYNIKI